MKWTLLYFNWEDCQVTCSNFRTLEPSSVFFQNVDSFFLRSVIYWLSSLLDFYLDSLFYFPLVSYSTWFGFYAPQFLISIFFFFEESYSYLWFRIFRLQTTPASFDFITTVRLHSLKVWSLQNFHQFRQYSGTNLLRFLVSNHGSFWGSHELRYVRSSFSFSSLTLYSC